MIDISKHITMAEATHSDTAIEHGIKNEPNIQEIKAMQYIGQTLFEPLRAVRNVAIEITSFFRSTALNALISKSSTTSQHMKGEAIDIKGLHGVTNAMLFYSILALHIPFDQLIWEYGSDYEPEWVHVSLKRSNNRGQILRSRKTKNGVKYDHIKP